MTARPAREEDRESMTRLYTECFGESLEQAAAAFCAAFSPGNALVYEESGVLASMLMLPQFFCGSLSGGYVFAACTAPEYRGRGLMALLLGESELLALSRGDGFLFLIPGERSLFSYYGRFGYKTAFYTGEEDTGAPGPAISEKSALRKAGPGDYAYINSLYEEKYKKTLYLKRSEDFYRKVDGVYALGGGGLFINGCGYVAADCGAGFPLIKEYAGEGVLEAAEEFFGVPPRLSVPVREGRPKGMVKPLDGASGALLFDSPLCFNLLFD